MASSHKKRTGLRAALIVLLCLVLVCVVAAAVLYSFVSRRVKAFQSGASFALDYTITSTEAEPPALYALLDKFGGTTGSLTGQYTPGGAAGAVPNGHQHRQRCPSDPDVHQRGRDPVRRRAAVQQSCAARLWPSIRWQACCCRAGRWAATFPKTSWPPCWG